MNISNLSELLQTRIINEGSMSAVMGFALRLTRCKQGYAFFSNDLDECKEAIKRGAFVIVTEQEPIIWDESVYFLQAKSLKRALAKFLRFLSEEKELGFLLCDDLEIDFCEAFGVVRLSGEINDDFELIIAAKNKSIFAFNDSEYLLNFCAKVSRFSALKDTKITHNSLFYSQITLQNDKIYKLRLCFAYAEIFAKFAIFLHENGKIFTINEKKFDFYRVYFIDQNGEFCEFGKSTRAFLCVQNERHFQFLAHKLCEISGFKVASNDSLFCDISYLKLSDLKGIGDFRYCLVKANFEDFEREFSLSQISQNEPNLFGISNAQNEAKAKNLFDDLNAENEPKSANLFDDIF